MFANIISTIATALVLFVLIVICKQAFLMSETKEALDTCAQIETCSGIMPHK